jgi:hypothetical protein
MSAHSGVVIAQHRIGGSSGFKASYLLQELALEV